MSDGTKLAIAVGVVAVVGFFVYKKATAAPSVGARNTAPASTTVAWTNGLFSALGSFASSFRSPNPNQGTAVNNMPQYAIGVPAADTTAYNTSPDYNAASGDYGPFLPSSSLPSS